MNPAPHPESLFEPLTWCNDCQANVPWTLTFADVVQPWRNEARCNACRGPVSLARALSHREARHVAARGMA